MIFFRMITAITVGKAAKKIKGQGILIDFKASTWITGFRSSLLPEYSVRHGASKSPHAAEYSLERYQYYSRLLHLW